MSETFSDMMIRERDRLNGEREALLTQQVEIQEKLGAVDREFAAIEAYAAAKDGRAPARLTRSSTNNTPRVALRARRGSKREDLIKLIRNNPNGLKRGEILEMMGLKGDRSGEMSVSNALTALTKNNLIRRHEGRYVASVA